MKFEWDSAKNQTNLEKHGLLFEDAVLIFLDPDAITFIDQRMEYGEERHIIIGQISRRVHVVAYCVRSEDTIRIISARKANRREQRRYANRQI